MTVPFPFTISLAIFLLVPIPIPNLLSGSIGGRARIVRVTRQTYRIRLNCRNTPNLASALDFGLSLLLACGMVERKCTEEDEWSLDRSMVGTSV